MMHLDYMYKGLRLAEAYVPPQKYISRYTFMDGLYLGTIFPELYRPYDETDC